MSKRVKFFLGHLGVSLLIALTTYYIVFYIWYPAPLSSALGIKHLIIMLILIDMIIGPLLGFVVYKEGKKTLKKDLSVIILIQICALCYGIYTISKGRPAWIVYNNGLFTLIKNSDIEKMNIKRAQKEFQTVSWTGPEYVTVKGLNNANNLPTAYNRYPDYYVPMNSTKIQGVPIDLLNKYNKDTLVKSTLKDYPTADKWAGLSAPFQNMVVLIDSRENKILGIVDLRPW